MYYFTWGNFFQHMFPIWVAACFFGSYTVLVCISTYILTSVQTRGKINGRLLTIMITMFVISTANMAADILQAMSYISVRLYRSDVEPCDGVEEKGTERLYHFLLKASAASTSLFVTNQTIGDLLLIYRCYILWGSRVWIVVLPFVLVIADLVLGFITVYLQTVSISNNWTASYVPWSNLTPSWVTLSLATNCLLTALIASRIWWASRWIGGDLPSSSWRQYRRAVLIVVESGALYSSTLIVYFLLLISVSNADSYYSYPAMIANQIVGIVPTLIVIRIHLGKHVDVYVTHGQTLVWAIATEHVGSFAGTL